MDLWQRYRDAILCVVLLSVPFFFLRTTTRDPSRYDPLDRVVVQVVAPAQRLTTSFSRGLADLWTGYLYLVHVRQDNERLQAENARLRAEASRHQSEYDENRRLRRLLQLRAEAPAEVIAAEVIARDTSPFFRVTRMALATEERMRVRTGMPVLSPDGLVGQVSRTFGAYADVLLTVDSRSAVDVMIERTGARGIVKGTGERDRYAARVEYLQRTDDVRVGDAVVTSGLGCRFPAGLLVGHVAAVTRREFGLHQEVEVHPAVDFSRLSDVLVLVGQQADRPTCRPGAGAAPSRMRTSEPRGGR
ncbi:MAG: rod shape-determining protein MreC [Deltaproteobacteria bacterium]|nr:rod shape-determining protein MreC [Deltaproteobacteria bacterium]